MLQMFSVWLHSTRLSWAVAGGVWVVVIEREWQERMGAVSRFFLQVVLWGSSALLAIWISDQFRV